MNRATFRALWIYRTFGDDARAETILNQMHNVGPAERDTARAVIRAIAGED